MNLIIINFWLIALMGNLIIAALSLFAFDAIINWRLRPSKKPLYFDFIHIAFDWVDSDRYKTGYNHIFSRILIIASSGMLTASFLFAIGIAIYLTAG